MIEATPHRVTKTGDPPDPALLRDARGGSDEAFRRIVKRHMHAVLGVARRRVGHGTLAEEIAQEVFVRLYRALDTIRPEAELGPWLRTVASNLAIDALRHRRRFADHVSIEALPPGQEPRTRVDAEERLRLEETRRVVWAALGRLAPERREVVILRFVAGWSYREIGQALGIAEGTVASRLHRALRELGNLIEPPGDRHGGGR